MEELITIDELNYYKILNECQKCLYLGMLAKRHGRSGSRIVSQAFKVDIKTARKGKNELLDIEKIAEQERVRRKVGNINLVKELTDRTATRNGLKVFTHINSKEYETGRIVDEKIKTEISGQITFDDVLPKWNYLIKPVE